MAVWRPEVDLGDEPGLAALLNRLVGEILHLVDQKLTLLKLEVTEELTRAARRSALLAAGGAAAGLGGLFLIVALAAWLGDVLGSRAGGFAMVGGVLVLGGVALAVGMQRRLAGQRFVPRVTMRELWRDKQWIKHEI